MRVRNFSRLGLVFLVLFTVLAAGVLFPLKPLDPAWQSRLTAALVNAATLPLLALPLPVLKAQAAAAFDQAQAQIARERATLPAMNPLWLLPEQLRNTSACLALAYGFAIFARRPGDPLSLLEALQTRLQRLSAGRRRRKANSEADYINQLCDSDQAH
ncbi:hypothetical protein NZK32_01785 [Cyanobium sp. FGCU-52]|nr:hypothetical protein [Cyanobium sp. FGCU52]